MRWHLSCLMLCIAQEPAPICTCKLYTISSTLMHRLRWLVRKADRMVVVLSPFIFHFFFKLWRFWYHKEAHIFVVTHVKFYSWNMFRLEDIDENVPGYGNHNWTCTVRYANCKSQNCVFTYSNFEFITVEWCLFIWNTKQNCQK